MSVFCVIFDYFQNKKYNWRLLRKINVLTKKQDPFFQVFQPYKILSANKIPPISGNFWLI